MTYVGAAMADSKIVNTILFCFECKRNIVMRGKSEWVDTGTKHSEARHMNHVTITACHRCVSQPGFTVASPYVNRSEIETGGMVDSVITMTCAIFGPPAVLNSMTDMNAIADAEETPTGMMKTLHPNDPVAASAEIPIMNLTTIMSQMTGSYGVMSMFNGRVTSAEHDFISAGKPIGQRDEILCTPFNVHTILSCAVCERNIIFTGFFTTLRLGPYIFEGREMAMIVFVQCSDCEDRNKLSDTAISEFAIAGTSAHHDPVEVARRYFSTAVNVNRYAPGALGEFAVVPRSAFVNRMKYHTEMWSLVDNEKTSPAADFV